MQDGVRPPIEAYLEAVHALSEEGVRVIQARLVERLGHSPQAVSEMVQRLSVDGYIERVGRGLALTELGHKQAERVVRRHRLAERFLVDVLGLPWHKAHEEAGQWEHVISDDVEDRLVIVLGNPTTCPHGNPIPGTTPSSVPQVAIAETLEGTTVRVARITEVIEDNYESLLYLSENGLTPGRFARIATKATDGTITLELDGTEGKTRHVALGPTITQQVYVTVA